MKKRKKRRRRLKLKPIAILLIIILILALFLLFFKKDNKLIPVKTSNMYVASETLSADIFKYNEEEDSMIKQEEGLVRGTKVEANLKKTIEKEKNIYVKINYNEGTYYINKNNLEEKENDVVKEKEVYVRSASTLLEDVDKSTIGGFAKKGEKLEVLDYDEINEDGSVNVYKVKYEDKENYIYGKYVVFDYDTAIVNYNADEYDIVHSSVKNSYGGGDAIKLDFYPNEKPEFEDNKMPDAVYSLYLNSTVLGDVDSYIEYAKSTKINAFVVDIVDDSAIGYASDVMKSISPSSYDKAINSVEDYKTAITKLKEAGFYVIGRITVFKDSYYVEDHKEDAISRNGELYLHNSAYWPSAYSRNVWYYKVALAKEAVDLFGFNEINYDYVRFPDRMTALDSSVDLHNEYEEDKIEAIQRFVTYATDELHKKNVYVSIDVFGESTNGTYTTAYGQYWPAISNVADVISGMPYPDHFAAGSYGIAKPWNNPYELMYNWASDGVKRQKECPTPAKVRTWVQAYDVMQYVDSNGIAYNGENLKKEIEGLYDAGAMDGYITWNSASNLEKYRAQKAAFDVDYLGVYSNGNNG